jgi:ketosteroid isomerase-like protein
MGVVRFTMTAEFPNGADYENEYTVWVEIRGGEIVKVWEYVDAAWTLAQMQSAGIELPSLG